MTNGGHGDGASVYALDQEWHREQERLAGMEQLWDPGTTSLIEALGLAPGWRCLEVGAGSGSIAVWLAERAGAAGEVVATDVSLAHLQGLEMTGLEVRRHDILLDPLPRDHFDLVHARLLVEHLGPAALPPMLAALRPGGWLMLESFDWTTAAMHPADADAVRVVDCLRRLMGRAGYDPEYGRKLVRELEGAGLRDVRAEGRTRVYRGGSRASSFLRLSIESLSPALLDLCGLGREELEAGLAAIDDPEMVLVTPPMIAAWGMKPA